MTPTFAIITATYNAADTLERTLDSIDSQTCKDFEHLIVDGRSKDNTVKIAKKHPSKRRKIISERDNGLYDAMNKGISLTKGTYLIFLNAGDKFHSSDTLQQIKNAIDSGEEPGIIYGQTIIVDNDGNFISNRHHSAPEKLTLKSFSKGMLVCHQAFIARRRITGFYDTRYKFSADYEWCIRCLQHSRHNIGLSDTILIDYLNEGLTTRNKIPSLLERFGIMTKYYGLFTTLFNHFMFIGRSVKRRMKPAKAK